MDKYAFLWQKLDEYFQGKYWFKPIGSRYKELIKTILDLNIRRG